MKHPNLSSFAPIRSDQESILSDARDFFLAACGPAHGPHQAARKVFLARCNEFPVALATLLLPAEDRSVLYASLAPAPSAEPSARMEPDAAAPRMPS